MKLRKVVSTGAMSVGALLLSFSLPAFAAGDEPAATADVSAVDPTCEIDIIVGCIDLPDPTTPAPTQQPTGPTVGPTDPEPTSNPTGPTTGPTEPEPTNDPEPTDDPTGPTVAPTNGGGNPDGGVSDAGAGAGAAQGDSNLGGFVADAQATAPTSTGTGSGAAASGDDLPQTGVSDQLNAIALTGAALLVGGAMLVIRRPHLARHKR